MDAKPRRTQFNARKSVEALDQAPASRCGRFLTSQKMLKVSRSTVPLQSTFGPFQDTSRWIECPFFTRRSDGT
jgi:hypothetical protein